MNDKREPAISAGRVGALVQLVRTLRLVWRLLFDRRVPIFPKLIILGAALYVISPFDLIPDVILGLGQLDDLAVVMLGIALFVELCPRAIVEEHRRAIAAESGEATQPSDENVIDGSFRVMSDDEKPNSDD
ncbi:MAG: DUF1232 domain-containing protein [Chloroflexota bacterium]|nr:DUF1232 domain-containing protein [Chloroflexota bacterium]